MTPKERFLTANQNGIPDRVPVTPDISNFIPCRLTGRPYWEIYFEGKIPLWQAYLQAADYFGIDAWMASCTGAPMVWGEAKFEAERELVYDKDEDAMVQHQTFHTPDGDLTARQLCYRREPPSPIQKPIKDLQQDWKKFKWLMIEPAGVDDAQWERMRAETEKRRQAFGVTIGYPGFHSWMSHVQGGVAPLSYAQIDCPEILDEWFEIDMARGTKQMELVLVKRPDYILLGGSGTITLASPDLARKYALPALKKWSAMAAEAGIPTQLHSCGKERVLVDILAEETDVNSVNPLEEPPMGDVILKEVKQARGQQIALMGNLHTTEVMLRGTPELVRQKSIEVMRAAARGGGFILSTGDQCGRDTPDENILAMVEAVEEYGWYDRDTGVLITE